MHILATSSAHRNFRSYLNHDDIDYLTTQTSAWPDLDAVSSPDSVYRLCIYCRALKPIAKAYPALHAQPRQVTAPYPISGLDTRDHGLISSLQRESSSLCKRCSGYDILGAFIKSEPADQMRRGNWPAESNHSNNHQYNDDMSRYRLAVGRVSSFILTPSCQFCRLLYAILPRDTGSDELHTVLEPYRSYIREDAWRCSRMSFERSAQLF